MTEFDETVVELAGVTKRFGPLTAVDNLSFSVERGSIVSLLGPSGCGKTTTLRLIAGFERPDAGAVRIEGSDMARRRPYERNVGLLFQNYALFPHMTVAENVAYGLRQRRVPRHEIRRVVAEMLALVKLTGAEDRRPWQLSGGQQQRVALARSLATRPQVILLDEPLSALDAKLRQELQFELKEILAAVGSTAIVVTHDQEEAMSLSQRILVMNRGRLIQDGTPEEIYERPVDRFVAEFIGRSNWFSGRVEADASHDGLWNIVMEGGERIRICAQQRRTSAHIDACVRPERMSLQAENAAGADIATNTLRGMIIDVAHLGANYSVTIALDGGGQVLVIAPAHGRARPQRGDRVAVSFQAEDCIVMS